MGSGADRSEYTSKRDFMVAMFSVIEDAALMAVGVLLRCSLSLYQKVFLEPRTFLRTHVNPAYLLDWKVQGLYSYMKFPVCRLLQNTYSM